MGRLALHPFCFLLVWHGFWDVGKKRVEGRSGASRRKPESAEAEGSKAQGTADATGEPKKKKRPVRCIQTHTDLEFRREFRDVCTGLLDKAKEGSTAHTRLLLEIGKSGERKTGRRRGKSLSEMLLDELKRRQDEREAATDEAKSEERKTNAKADNNEDAASGECVEEK